MIFDSKFSFKGSVQFPQFTGIRIMMLPIELGNLDSIPDFAAHYKPTIAKLFDLSDCKEGIAYVTIDEKQLIGSIQPLRPIAQRRSSSQI